MIERATGTGRDPGLDRAGSPDRAVGISRSLGASRRVGVEQWDILDESELREYQVAGSKWLRSMSACLLADEMGTGKTAQMLRALRRHDRVIVVCPASVLLAWVKQVVRWRPEFRITIREALRKPDEGEIVAVSQDSLPEAPAGSRVLLSDSLSDVTLIVDECHGFKSYRAQRTKRLRKLAAQCGRVWGATATPMLGSPEDLWGVLSSLKLAGIFDGWEEFVSLCAGKKRYMRDRKTGALREIGHVWGTISPEVGERLRKVMLRRTVAEVLPELPPKRYVDVPVPAPDDLREFLDSVKAGWDAVEDGDLPPFELLSEARAALARSRIPAALEYVRETAEAMPLLVFSSHVDPILAMKAIPNTGCITGQTSLADRNHLIDMFQAGMLRVLALTIDAGGVGLTLTAAGGVVFIDRDYTPALNSQAEGRAVRFGQEHQSVLIARLVSDHPLDERMNEILDEKQRLISAAIDAPVRVRWLEGQD